MLRIINLKLEPDFSVLVSFLIDTSASTNKICTFVWIGMYRIFAENFFAIGSFVKICENS